MGVVMTDLARAVDTLVDTAMSGAKGKALQKAVGGVVDAFDASDVKAARAALKKLDASMGEARGHAARVIELTIGALVEAGAPPEAAWPAVSRELEIALDGATRFALACAEAAKTQHLETALEKAGAKIAKKMPDEVAAWEALPSRCLAGVACLTRSSKVRAAARKQGLVEAAFALEDAVDEVGYLSQALRVLDDAPLLVLHPELGRGYRVKISEIGWNAELFALLSDALVGDPKKGKLPGERPDPRAIAALTGEGEAPKSAKLFAPFAFVGWTALEADGSLPPAEEVEDHWLWVEGVPADIPPHGGARVVLLTDAPRPQALPSERAFEALRPRVKVEAKLTAAAVKKLLVTMGKAAAKARRGR